MTAPDSTNWPAELADLEREHEVDAAEDDVAARSSAIALLTLAGIRLRWLPVVGNLFTVQYACEAEDYLRGAARLLPDRAADLRAMADRLHAAIDAAGGPPLTSAPFEEVEIAVDALLAALKQEAGDV